MWQLWQLWHCIMFGTNCQQVFLYKIWFCKMGCENLYSNQYLFHHALWQKRIPTYVLTPNLYPISWAIRFSMQCRCFHRIDGLDGDICNVIRVVYIDTYRNHVHEYIFIYSWYFESKSLSCVSENCALGSEFGLICFKCVRQMRTVTCLLMGLVNTTNWWFLRAQVGTHDRNCVLSQELAMPIQYNHPDNDLIILHAKSRLCLSFLKLKRGISITFLTSRFIQKHKGSNRAYFTVQVSFNERFASAFWDIFSEAKMY